MKKLLFAAGLLCLVPSLIHADLEYGGKTFFALARFDSLRCQELALWHTHTTTDVGNPYGFSFQATSFFNKGVHTENIAQHFTYKESELITIASDRFNQNSDRLLPYHAIKHNIAPDAQEESASVKLLPHFSNVGVLFSLFYDAHDACPGLALSFQMPLFYTTATLNQSGATRTIEQYFDGTYSQANPLQAPLSYGKFGQHRFTVCGPLSISMRYNLIENQHNYLTVYAGAGITLKKAPVQTFLFDYHSTVYDHHKLIAGFEAGATIFRDKGITIDLTVQTNYHYAFKGKENRLLGVLDDDGSAPRFSSYLMGAEHGVAGVFPLANVLHRNVERAGCHQADIACMGEISWQGCTASFGYELFCREEERLEVDEWPASTYAIVAPTYATTAPFTDATSTGALDEHHTILLNHRFLTRDMINVIPATSPAQAGCRLSGGVGYNTQFYDIPVGFGCGLSYTHGFNNATASLLGCWLKAVISL